MVNERRLNEMYHAVCNAPQGNGFSVVRLPDLLKESEMDDCKAHVHSFYEILWFQEGEGHHTVDFQEYAELRRPKDAKTEEIQQALFAMLWENGVSDAGFFRDLL